MQIPLPSGNLAPPCQKCAVFSSLVGHVARRMLLVRTTDDDAAKDWDISLEERPIWVAFRKGIATRMSMDMSVEQINAWTRKHIMSPVRLFDSGSDARLWANSPRGHGHDRRVLGLISEKDVESRAIFEAVAEELQGDMDFGLGGSSVASDWGVDMPSVVMPNTLTEGWVRQYVMSLSFLKKW